jgi:hypothetical protein
MGCVLGKPLPSSAHHRLPFLCLWRHARTVLPIWSRLVCVCVWQVASQIRTLEAQLHSLRVQQAEIEEKRGSLASRQRAAWESAGGARKQVRPARG